jgi:hypothetical protein
MRIAVIPGDGIGKEVTAEAVKVLRSVERVYGRSLDIEQLPYGADYFLQTGTSLPNCPEGGTYEFGADGTIYCTKHFPKPPEAATPAAATPGGTSPFAPPTAP